MDWMVSRLAVFSYKLKEQNIYQYEIRSLMFLFCLDCVQATSHARQPLRQQITLFSFQMRSRISIRGCVGPSVRRSFGRSVGRSVTSIFDRGFRCFEACRDLLLPLPNRTRLRQPCIRLCSKSASFLNSFPPKKTKNKAVCTAILVACGWAKAVISLCKP